MELIEKMSKRYATKKFNPERLVSPEDLESLKEVIQLSASSYGLQPYRVVLVEDKRLREQLRPFSWGQAQITDASHLFVFCNLLSVGEGEVSAYVDLKARAQGKKPQELSGYIGFVTKKIGEKSILEQRHWTAKQSYIAMANLLTACAAMDIDACPIEGFEPEKYNELLNLESKGLEAAVVVAVGYRADDDANASLPKIRKSQEELFIEM